MDFQGNKIYLGGNTYTDTDKEQSKGPNVKSKWLGPARNATGIIEHQAKSS